MARKVAEELSEAIAAARKCAIGALGEHEYDLEVAEYQSARSGGTRSSEGWFVCLRWPGKDGSTVELASFWLAARDTEQKYCALKIERGMGKDRHIEGDHYSKTL